MQIICTLLQTDNPRQHFITQFFTGRMLFLTPSQQCQSTEGKQVSLKTYSLICAIDGCVSKHGLSSLEA